VSYELALQTSGAYPALLDDARWAEARGLTALALPDHYVMSLNPEAVVPAYDALAQLAALARDTTSLQLSVLVSPVTYRHPAVLAKTALTINELSGGRFTLGVGTGWLEREHTLFGFPFPDVATRFEMMEEALAYVRAMITGDAAGFSGDHFVLDEAETLPSDPGLRLVVGGTGPHKTPRLAGMYADEYNCYPAPIDEFRSRVDRARSAAAEAGRDPDRLMISSSGNVVAGRTRKEYQEVLTERAAENGMSREEAEAHLERRNTPRGTYNQVAAQLAELTAAGMRRFYLQRPAEFDRDADEELMAALRT
jgi:alkanesulfonate monooxygenase SsuD/methylene tetrahydromethanopterin reductase-like flavin-dependent oxidoreductase (luciferase family)